MNNTESEARGVGGLCEGGERRLCGGGERRVKGEEGGTDCKYQNP